MHDHRVLDIVEGNTEQGAGICLWEEHGGDNQKWDFDYLYVSYLQCCSFKVAEENAHLIADIGAFDPSFLILNINIAECSGRMSSLKYTWLLNPSVCDKKQ